MKILVRERELACRNAWGDDLWADSSSPATTSPSAEPPRRTFTYLTTRLDDEVTSVVDASVRQAPRAAGDDIVTLTSVRPSDGLTPANDVNSAAVADQEERARVMARGSRDAILSARRRHVERRTQGTEEPTRDTESAPDAEPPETDLIISTSDGSADTGPTPSNTPQASLPEPSITPDSVASEVGLPRLRSFLRGEETPADVAQPAYATSHFDHVMRQAERIKERSNGNRSQPPVQPEIVAEPMAAPASKEQPFIWDVDPSALDVAFERARLAIETPADSSSTIQPNDVPATKTEARLEPATDPGPRLALYQQAPSVELPVEPSPAPANEDYDELDFDVVQFDGAGNDEFHDDVPYDDELVPDESPRSSLWRSFNQRIRQRFRFQAPQPTSEDIYLEADAYVDNHEDLAFEEDIPPVDLGFQTNDPDSWYSPQSDEEPDWIVGVDSGAYDDGQDEGLDIWNTTSEESWRLDEREFPEPQPEHWHESRQQLLASLPPVEALDDSVQLVAPTPQATPAIPIKPRRPLPDPEDFFDISEPGGLAAFRAALFGEQQVREPSPSYLDAPPAVAAASVMQQTERSPRRSAPRETVVDRRADVEIHEDQYNQELEGLRAEAAWSDDWNPSHQADTQSYRDVDDVAIPERRTSRRPVPVRPAPAPAGDKRCETCRSFQAAEDGNRGWCTNAWASTRNAMVNADELACRSSFGDWWIAADDAWSHRSEQHDHHHDTRDTAPTRHVRTRNVGD